ncbi:MAG: hypothetical protein LBG65_03180 [Puniceicoccales bacterium]|jgi:hypothetical protein|nr:hypothetical protein [Puniceicoccales bacterium]
MNLAQRCLRFDSLHAVAKEQYDLGGMLFERAMEGGVKERMRFLTKSAVAFRSALRGYSKDKFPKNWADAQFSLGLVLFKQAELRRWPMRRILLCKSTDAFRKALKVYSKDKFPEKWGAINENLRSALRFSFWRDPGMC